MIFKFGWQYRRRTFVEEAELGDLEATAPRPELGLGVEAAALAQRCERKLAKVLEPLAAVAGYLFIARYWRVQATLHDGLDG